MFCLLEIFEKKKGKKNTQGFSLRWFREESNNSGKVERVVVEAVESRGGK